MSVRELSIVGPTASGKSAVALEVARRLGGVELISVDSMQVFRGMDVGTATPSPDELAEVPHHLVNVLDPEQECTVVWFQQSAAAARREITARGHATLLVGGTGLYHRAVVDRLEVPGRYPQVATELAAEADTALLHRRLAELDPVAAARTDPLNRRRIERALEVTLGSGRPFSAWGPGLAHYPPTDVVQVGLWVEPEQLQDRIDRRLEAQLANGFVEEVRCLAPRRWSRTAGQALGYAELRRHLADEMTLDDAVSRIRRRTRQFAVRQLRWFRRDPRIQWIPAPSDPGDLDRVAEEVMGRWTTGPCR